MADGRFDVSLSMTHDVPPAKQADLIAVAAKHLNDGPLLYKDMSSRPLWRAWANRLHDLVSAREWIHYAELESVIKWAKRRGPGTSRKRGDQICCGIDMILLVSSNT